MTTVLMLGSGFMETGSGRSGGAVWKLSVSEEGVCLYNLSGGLSCLEDQEGLDE